MEPFKVHILGCGSAKPTTRHYASSQVVEIRGKLFMIDCGEGTQTQLCRMHIGYNKIISVFISHLHGDHCFGLMGMISSFGLQGRTAPLHIYAPKELESLLNLQLDFFCKDLEYSIVFHAVDTFKEKIIYEDRSLTVSTIPLDHRIPCCGFLFKEKPTLPHIRRDMINFYNIPLSQINNIKNGQSWISPEGKEISSELLTIPSDPPRCYAYCSDTCYKPDLVNQLRNVNLLYHEATYADDKEDGARKYYHSTARQAAMIAKAAGVGQLLIGHYSARYKDDNILLDEAKSVFSNTLLSNEKMIVCVK